MRILVLLLLFLIAFGSIAAQAAELPSSERSRRAVEGALSRLQGELEQAGLQAGQPIFIRIFKQSSELELWIAEEDRFRLFKTYGICSFSGWLGPKLRQGDRQSPEGFYYVTPGRMNPYSSFHLSFDLGYPNRYDRHHGRTGGDLMVHGSCVSIGCYAMTDERIEEIYALAEAALRQGQPYFRVHIFPFRMIDENFRRHRGSQWQSFWENLREGYDIFQQFGLPPNVEVVDGRYHFEPLDQP
jgi:murein L,D-transpeptidase YafK